MTLFSKPKTDWAAVLEEMARAKEPEVLAHGQELFAQHTKHREKDLADFVFECRRWGDFLSIFTRRTIFNWWTNEYKTVENAQTLNLGSTKSIQVVEGYPPDQAGYAVYHIVLVSDLGGERWLQDDEGYPEPPAGSHYEVRPNHEEDFDNQTTKYFTEGYARSGEEDRIVFDGLDIDLRVPAGKGQEVLQAILAEIARAYEPKALP